MIIYSQKNSTFVHKLSLEIILKKYFQKKNNCKFENFSLQSFFTKTWIKISKYFHVTLKIFISSTSSGTCQRVRDKSFLFFIIALINFFLFFFNFSSIQSKNFHVQFGGYLLFLVGFFLLILNMLKIVYFSKRKNVIIYVHHLKVKYIGFKIQATGQRNTSYTHHYMVASC